MSQSGRETRFKILAFIDQYQVTNGGRSPAYSQIVDGCGMRSGGHLHHHMQVLQRQGRIEPPERWLKGAIVRQGPLFGYAEIPEKVGQTPWR